MSTTPSSPPPAPRSRRGRPPKLDDLKRSKFCAAVSLGCDLCRAARLVGCSYPTIRRETLRHPEFREKLRRARRNHARINALRRSDPEIRQVLSAFEQKLQINPPPVPSPSPPHPAQPPELVE